MTTGAGTFNDVQVAVSPAGAIGSFTVTVVDDGDAACTGTAVGVFSGCGMPTIPTLSEWGLITLLLLLMSYGSIAMVGASKLAGVSTHNLPMPFNANFNLPFNNAIYRKALIITGLLVAIGFALSIAVIGY